MSIKVQLTLVLIPLELLLLADVPPDLDFVQSDGTHAVTAGPEAPAEQRPLGVQQLPVDPGRTLPLPVADRYRDAVSWRHAQQHVDVVRHCLPFHKLDILLPAQVPQDLADAPTDPPVQPLATVLREDHDVILAVPLHVGLTLPILHGRSSYPEGPSSRRTVPHPRRERQSL